MNKKNNFIDDLNSEKLESFQEEEFIKQKKNLIPTIIFISTLLIIMVVLLLIFTKGSTVPDMIGWKENDVSTWGKNSNAAVVYESRYSDDTGTGEVIEQQLAPGSKLKRNGTIIITISRGADPNENIVFPDVKEMNLTEINRWINENKLSGISIKRKTVLFLKKMQ